MVYDNKRQPSGRQSSTGMSAFKEMVILIGVVFIIRTFGFGLYQVPTGSMETTMLVGERFFADKFTPLFTKPQRGEIIAFNDPVFDYSPNALVRLYQEYVGWPIWPWGPVNWTKRVIGIPGDHVKGTIEDGKPVVYLNDKKLDEPYINKYPLLALRDAENRNIDWRSYDPSRPYNDQQFYNVKESRIIHVDEISPNYFDTYYKNNTTVMPDGRLLREPGTPIEMGGHQTKIQKGDSYWTHTDEFDVHLGDNQYWLMGDNRRGSHDCRFFGPVDGRLIHGKILYRIWSIDSDESWWIVDLIKHPIDFWKRMRWCRFFQRVK